MPTGERLLLIVKCLLPALLITLLAPYPASIAVRDNLQAARANQSPGNAAAALREAVEREPWRTGLWEEIGRLELAANAPERALAAFRRADHASALTAEGRILLGDSCAMLEQPDNAQAAWRQVLQDPAPAEARLQAFERLENQQRQQGSLAEAVETLRVWHAEAPDNAGVAYRLGTYLVVLDPEAALVPLLEASRLDAAYTASVQILRGGINLASGSQDSAYGAVVTGRALGRVGEWDLAAVSLRRAVALDPQYGEGWAFLGEALYHTGEAGTQEITHALELDPGSVAVRALAAAHYRRQNDPGQALIHLYVIAQQQPDEPIWQVEIGSTLAQRGDLPAALLAYQKAVEIAPQDAFYWQHLARFSIDYNHDIHITGLPAARRAMILAPDDPASLDVMGWALLSLSDWASAERFLQQAVKGDAAYAPAHLHLGLLYLQRNQREQAHPFIQRAVVLAGNDDPVGQAARRLLQQYYGGE